MISYSAAYSANTVPLSTSYKHSLITSIDDYSINLNLAYVGQMQSNVTLNARHTEDTVTACVGTNTRKSDTPNNGAGVTFMTKWDFFDSVQVFDWAGAMPSTSS